MFDVHSNGKEVNEIKYQTFLRIMCLIWEYSQKTYLTFDYKSSQTNAKDFNIYLLIE